MIDNFGLYDIYEREQDRRAAHYPKCDLCGDAICDYGYRISYQLSSLLICEPCMEQAREYVDEEEEF